MKNLFAKTILFAALLVAMGCANDDNNNDDRVERPSGTNGWSEVAISGESAVRGPNCDSPITFTALSDGRFTKSCGSVGQTMSGVLSDAELEKLDELAGKVAGGDLGVEDCDSGSPVTYFMDLTMDDGAKTRLIDVRDAEDETCWRGSKTDATNLRNHVLILVGKYQIRAPTTTTLPPVTTTTMAPPTTTTTTLVPPPSTVTLPPPTTMPPR